MSEPLLHVENLKTYFYTDTALIRAVDGAPGAQARKRLPPGGREKPGLVIGVGGDGADE